MKAAGTPPALFRKSRRGVVLLVAGVLLMAAGHGVLWLPPGAPLATAVEQAFTGLGLVVLGALTAIASRFIR